MGRRGLALVSWGSIVVCVFIIIVAVGVGLQTQSWLTFLGFMAIAVVVALFAGWFDKKANPRYVAITRERVEIDVPGKGRVLILDQRQFGGCSDTRSAPQPARPCRFLDSTGDGWLDGGVVPSARRQARSYLCAARDLRAGLCCGVVLLQPRPHAAVHTRSIEDPTFAPPEAVAGLAVVAVSVIVLPAARLRACWRFASADGLSGACLVRLRHIELLGKPAKQRICGSDR